MPTLSTVRCHGNSRLNCCVHFVLRFSIGVYPHSFESMISSIGDAVSPPVSPTSFDPMEKELKPLSRQGRSKSWEKVVVFVEANDALYIVEKDRIKGQNE